ncbi:MAG: hypothetical protein ACKVS6_02740, partial [Planctomycetota bacterium]
SIELVPVQKFINHWWISPPVDADPKGGIEFAPAHEKIFTSAEFDPAKEKWKIAIEENGIFDLNKHVTTKAPIFGYLYTQVHSSFSHDILTKIGSDDGVRIWVNGEVAYTREIHRPLKPDEDSILLKLKKGWNSILVKVRNNYGGYGFCMRFADPTGAVELMKLAK